MSDRLTRADGTGYRGRLAQVMLCLFAEGPDFVAVHGGPVKGLVRMREKLLEYAHAGDAWADWPLVANILDPIRATIVCNSPSQILQVPAPSAF